MSAILTVFIVKSLDCVFGVLKTVYLCKNKFLVSSMFNSLSAVFFILCADYVTSAEGDKSLILIAIFMANLIGSYFPPKAVDYFEKDKLHVYEITSDTFESGKDFADTIRKLNIPIVTTSVYDKNNNKVLLCKVFSFNKDVSKLIEHNISDRFKWHKRLDNESED